ncbi:hypothetical protein [Alienimonas californiensis]|uniref:Uncharacterized protein n=1 Tax=Alienimonas californiensis TaxID=2527989 RepID=A0A517P3P3_9PLAN|nr:hypothetical protein [Alienimonas californiensis]QDT13989.1 hypothetical protein CA12_00570 [Alienimonas californiensis]
MSAVAESLLCDRCGAPLTVGPRARFVTCTHCGARLSVHRSDSAAWTETLEEVAAATGRIEAKLDALHRRPQLDALEQEWERMQDELGVPVRLGRRRPPTAKDASHMALGFQTLAVLTFGAIAIGAALKGEGGAFLFGLLWASGVGALMWCLAWLAQRGGIERVQRYEAAERDYRRRRAELLGGSEAAGERRGEAR